MAFTSKELNVNGLNFHVVDEGKPGDPVVLLLHGFPDSSELWRYQIQALVDAGYTGAIRRVASLNSFIPLGRAANWVLLASLITTGAVYAARPHIRRRLQIGWAPNVGEMPLAGARFIAAASQSSRRLASNPRRRNPAGQTT